MSRSNRPAFSMIGLLVVFAILALLIAIFAPLVARVRLAAARTQGLNNLRQLGIGAHAFHDVTGRLPPIVGKGMESDGTLHFHLLPFLEQEPAFRQGRGDWTRISNRVIPILVEPEDPTAPPGNLYQNWLATTNYAGNWMMFRDGGMNFGNVTDGLSNTSMFTQRYQMCNGQPTGWAYPRLHYWAPMFGFYSSARFQTAPRAEECDPGLPQALSRSGIAVLMGDASVRTVSDLCSPQTWFRATHPADGEALGADFN